MLLYQTDHTLLLEQCRTKMENYRSSRPEKEVNDIVHEDFIRSQRGIKIYNKLFNLPVSTYYIDGKSILLEFHSGFESVEVVAFAENSWGHGDIKLIDGLWYNDEGFRKKQNFSDYLERLKPNKEKF